jgi:hypothetical protein
LSPAGVRSRRRDGAERPTRVRLGRSPGAGPSLPPSGRRRHRRSSSTVAAPPSSTITASNSQGAAHTRACAVAGCSGGSSQPRRVPFRGSVVGVGPAGLVSVADMLWPVVSGEGWCCGVPGGGWACGGRLPGWVAGPACLGVVVRLFGWWCGWVFMSIVAAGSLVGVDVGWRDPFDVAVFGDADVPVGVVGGVVVGEADQGGVG